MLIALNYNHIIESVLRMRIITKIITTKSRQKILGEIP